MLRLLLKNQSRLVHWYSISSNILNASVKDTKDKQTGEITVATAKMLTANKGRSRLGASVSVKFSQEFATQVSWQKIDERTGATIEEEDITDGSDTPGGGGDTPGGDNGGSGGDNGSGDLEG